MSTTVYISVGEVDCTDWGVSGIMAIDKSGRAAGCPFRLKHPVHPNGGGAENSYLLKLLNVFAHVGIRPRKAKGQNLSHVNISAAIVCFFVRKRSSVISLSRCESSIWPHYFIHAGGRKPPYTQFHYDKFIKKRTFIFIHILLAENGIASLGAPIIISPAGDLVPHSSECAFCLAAAGKGNAGRWSSLLWHSPPNHDHHLGELTVHRPRMDHRSSRAHLVE